MARRRPPPSNAGFVVGFLLVNVIGLALLWANADTIWKAIGDWKRANQPAAKARR